MTTYLYHLPISDDGDPRKKMAEHLERFLGEALSVVPCLELHTDQEHVASAVEALFGLRPDLIFDDLPALEKRMAQVVHDAEQPATIPTFEEVQNDVASMKTCLECGLLFFPDSPRQKYCGKKCSSRSGNRAYAARKAANNGNHPEPGPITALAAEDALHELVAHAEEPPTEPIAVDVIANQTMRWLIASSGTEVESVTQLLSAGKLAEGERLHHKTKGWWEIFRNDFGSLDVRKIQREV